MCTFLEINIEIFLRILAMHEAKSRPLVYFDFYQRSPFKGKHILNLPYLGAVFFKCERVVFISKTKFFVQLTLFSIHLQTPTQMLFPVIHTPTHNALGILDLELFACHELIYKKNHITSYYYRKFCNKCEGCRSNETTEQKPFGELIRRYHVKPEI